MSYSYMTTNEGVGYCKLFQIKWSCRGLTRAVKHSLLTPQYTTVHCHNKIQSAKHIEKTCYFIYPHSTTNPLNWMVERTQNKTRIKNIRSKPKLIHLNFCTSCSNIHVKQIITGVWWSRWKTRTTGHWNWTVHCKKKQKKHVNVG